ncbi:MAG TPA: DUF309 domain-containing protein [Nitrososphaerales archaeon]|nr:DUF309 domain-containing protein [Nitrososphaerales archaeon]
MRVKGTKPKAEFLSEVRSLSKSLGLDPRNAKWTSYGALEMDFFAPSKEDFHLFLAALEPLAKIEFSRDDLNDAPTHHSKQDTIDQAVDYFNRERFWESHEVFESLWRTISGEEKSYIQGIILVCAAFVHEQKGERKVAMGIFRRARRQLDYSRAEYHGISVSNLANKVDETLATENPKVFRI